MAEVLEGDMWDRQEQGCSGTFILGDVFSLPQTTVYGQCDNYRLGIWPTYSSLAALACPSSP